ncbi:hypothetical protein RA28_13350 [Ruegeria sp. ANG-S4]|nr:hypothetical protein RA28_13350 [Ruegeria sp. ANG-S4]
MKTCSIVQFEARHEEVIPSLINILNRLGYRPKVFLNRRIRRVRGDIFSEFPELDAEIKYTGFKAKSDTPPSVESWPGDVESEILSEDVDFIVMNSFNRPSAANWARGCGKPVIALIHNVDQYVADAVYSETLDLNQFAFLTLADHVSATLFEKIGGRYAEKVSEFHCDFFSATRAPYRPSKRRSVVIPGNLNLRTRNYKGLIDVLKERRSSWDALEFILPSSGADRDTVLQEISENRLQDRVFALPLGGQGQVPHASVMAAFRNATVLLALIKPGFDQYRRNKVTSSVFASSGFSLPMSMGGDTSDCYSIPHLPSTSSLAEELDQIGAISDAELYQISSRIDSYRKDKQQISQANLAGLIDQIVDT